MYSLFRPYIPLCLVPCPHSGVQASVDCDSNTALVSWTPGRGIREYYASADAFSISHKLDCSTNGSSCNISALRCGQRYRVSVGGRGENCPSPTESWQPITTGTFHIPQCLTSYPLFSANHLNFTSTTFSYECFIPISFLTTVNSSFPTNAFVAVYFQLLSLSGNSFNL